MASPATAPAIEDGSRRRLAAAPSAGKSARWVQEYREKRAQWNIERAEAKQAAHDAAQRKLERASHAQHDHRVFLLDLSTALPPISSQDVKPRERWREVWGRNDICEQSGLPTSPGFRLECAYCPVVVRHDRAARMYNALRLDPLECQVGTVGEAALQEGRRAALAGGGQTCGEPAAASDEGDGSAVSRGKGLLQSAASRVVGGGDAGIGDWVCAQCVHDCRANRRNMARVRLQQATSWTRQRSAMLITAFMRRACDRHRYLRIQRGVTLVASRLRAKLTMRAIARRMVLVRRPQRIRVLRARGLKAADFGPRTANSSDPFVCITVLNDKYDQIFRFDTSTKPANLDPDWDEFVVAPGIDGNCIVYFTVIDEDELRDDFLGQAVVRMKGTDIWKHGFSGELELGAMETPPKESNRQNMRLGSQNFEGQGTITVEIKPCDHACSISGFVEEKASAVGSSSGGRRWWGALYDGNLRLFAHWGEMRAKHTLNVRKGLPLSPQLALSEGKVTASSSELFNLRMADKVWTFEPQPKSAELAHEWAVKLRAWRGVKLGISKKMGVKAIGTGAQVPGPSDYQARRRASVLRNEGKRGASGDTVSTTATPEEDAAAATAAAESATKALS